VHLPCTKADRVLCPSLCITLLLESIQSDRISHDFINILIRNLLPYIPFHEIHPKTAKFHVSWLALYMKISNGHSESQQVPEPVVDFH
jgi:hypothetical protein